VQNLEQYLAETPRTPEIPQNERRSLNGLEAMTVYELDGHDGTPLLTTIALLPHEAGFVVFEAAFHRDTLYSDKFAKILDSLRSTTKGERCL
jgi:hypothetical protein